MKQKKRIMIIIWKWTALEHCTIGLEELRRYSDKPKAGIGSFRGDLFDEFEVAPLAQKDEKAALDALLVRLRIQKGEALNSIPFIKDLIRYYAGGGNDVFAFLHRGEGFTSQEIKAILDDTPVKKCFLFGGGRDYLYSDEHHVGLIEDGGNFHSQKPGKNNNRIEVANEDKKIVGLSYFDKVWNYYKHEFFTKIFGFKEDLLRHFYSIHPSDVVWPKARLEAHLIENKSLWLRTKSFINDCYASLNAPDEVKQLEEIERKRQAYYVFDDCKRNLEQMNGIRVEYEKASQYLCGMLFNPGSGNNAMQYSLNQHLINIQHRFDELLMNLRQNDSL